MRPNAHGNHSWPESLEPEEAEPKAPAQEAEEAPAETPEVQTEASDEESDEELEAWAPPEVLPPPSASPVAAVEPGPAWEAPADMTEAPPPLDEEPSLEPAQGPASEEELPPESPAAPAPEPQAETARRLPSEKLVLPPLVDLFLLFSFLFMFHFSSWGYSIVYFLIVIIQSILGSFCFSLFFFLLLCFVSPWGDSTS
ncbi:fibrous sheath CABYR-binding protein-like [Eptesicus fuscus]|uniref:fibrous sheath CABYR-binding protein-like n=1 Tax=Eptesicus fuscus TaxID=29078 RepID=UPI0024044BA0|nr:fibrous sheath CABYR-binding protein-like [Eptesicus fuscus]